MCVRVCVCVCVCVCYVRVGACWRFSLRIHIFMFVYMYETLSTVRRDRVLGIHVRPGGTIDEEGLMLTPRYIYTFRPITYCYVTLL